MKTTFARGAWDTNALTYAYSYRFPETPEFHQADDHVENAIDPNQRHGWDFVSLLTREKYGYGTRVTTNLSFAGDGAPIITWTGSLDTDAEGNRRYGDYFEVVVWKNGVNVWRLKRDPSVLKEGGVSWVLLLSAEFSLEQELRHTLTVDILACRMIINVDDKHIFKLYSDDLPASFHAGINACEGLCKFYDLSVEADAEPMKELRTDW